MSRWVSQKKLIIRRGTCNTIFGNTELKWISPFFHKGLLNLNKAKKLVLELQLRCMLPFCWMHTTNWRRSRADYKVSITYLLICKSTSSSFFLTTFLYELNSFDNIMKVISILS
ncbi:uncharacterized protein LOC110118761 isoform X1 [Ceratitis capitata]|uniref:uncharacterized protein LOC110118761 isoform X1 n=1 Tax=Ceratitis capitata TaxID=7213 RepID=UPI000A111935|nr:uncharacterized protein LOC110118761 isoform X1 [Ceratitis capitata]